MSPGAIMGLVSAGIGGLQAGISSINMRKTRKAAEKAMEDVPTYTASDESQKYLAMRQRRLGTGIGATATDIAKQGIGTSTAQGIAAASAFGKGAGLGSLGGLIKGRQKAYQDLAAQSAAAEERNLASFGQASQWRSAEKEKQFLSEQEKKQQKASYALQKLAAKKQAVQQGISGMMSGLSGVAQAEMYKGDFSLGGKKNKVKEEVNTGD